MPLHLTAKDITKQRLPDLNLGPYKTKSDSRHNIEFRQCLGEWTGFEREVRRIFLSQIWPSYVLAYHPGPQEGHPHDIHHEHVYCGDEISVVGRFSQHIGQVMSAVFQNLGMDIHMGDFRTT